jgi:hypothetical protein
MSTSRSPHRPHLLFSPYRWLLLSAIVLLISACAAATPAPATTPQSVPTAAVTSAPPAATAEVVTVAAADVADLPQIVADSMGITIQPGGNAWESIEALPLTPDLWVAYTTGFRSFDPDIKHTIAIYTQQAGEWVELGRAELECGDYVNPDSMQQVRLDEASIWLAVDSGAGAHSGCFDLLRWDGSALTIAVSGFNSSPGAGEVKDVDGDGQPEVVLNATDPYVFCYACGVRLYNVSILRWDGSALIPVELTRLPDDTVTDLRNANNRAVELAAASLFPAAIPLIDEALGYAPSDERVYWNSQIIHALAQGREEYAASTPYPLLNWIFYGDWDAALAELEEYSAAQIFDPQMAILQEGVTAGWEETLADWILTFSGPALEADPDLAPAWFLQAWARFLKNPGDPAVAQDVAEAARLGPDNVLYRTSENQLGGRGISQPTATPTSIPSPTATPTTAPSSAIPSPATVETVRFLAGATVHELPVTFSGSAARGYTLGMGAGQKLYVNWPGNLSAWLVNSAGQAIPGVADAGAVRYDIPATANYTLILQGSGTVNILLAIPPLGQPETPAPTSTERVRFPAGGTSATLEPTLTRGAPIGYVMGIGAGQRLWVTAPLGDMGFWVLDPSGKTLSPIVPQTARSAEYAIPRTGDYTLVLNGEGPVQVVVDIPPR